MLCTLFSAPVAAQTDIDWSEADSRVMSIFRAAYDWECTSLEGESGPQPQIVDLTFSYEYEEGEGEHPFRVYRIHCFNGAYNEVHVFYGANEYGEVKQIYFAEPSFDLTYPDDNYESSTYKVRVTGMTAYDMVVNSEIDPETGTIYEYSKWRGIGDASNFAEWVFHEGTYVLNVYDIDASYDGEFERRRIFGEGTPPALQ